ncbi:hypothetical protein C0992_011094 [Termitomyces sp. T32_za158]|nr:hypothetical protein C0992_011094 [Termitomyces sp. T32_za158]
MPGSSHPSIDFTPVQQSNYLCRPASSASGLHKSPMKEEPEPLSAYARWKLEEDERFYATFPAARCAAQQYSTVSSAYLVGTGHYYDEEGRIARPNELTYKDDHSYAFTIYENAPSPEPHRAEHHYDIDYSDSDLARALASTSQHGTARNNGPSTSQYNPTPPPCPPRSPVETNSVVHSQQPFSIPEPPLMDSLPSPDSPTHPAPLYTYSKPDMIPKTEYPLRSLAYADVSLYDMPAYSSSYNFYPTTPQDGWPVCTPFPRSIRLSPLPSSRRPMSKKPPLACLFCRGRKIACGPPDPGSSNRSCK